MLVVGASGCCCTLGLCALQGPGRGAQVGQPAPAAPARPSTPAAAQHSASCPCARNHNDTLTIQTQIYELESVYFTADYTNFGNVVKVGVSAGLVGGGWGACGAALA